MEIDRDTDLNIILKSFNDTDAGYSYDKTITELFEKQVVKTPDAPAIITEDRVVTYSEFNQRANSVARILRDKGVKNNQIVGIMMERSLEMMVGIFGVVKAGGAYLPIDPNYPLLRKIDIIKDSGISLILVNRSFPELDIADIELLDISHEPVAAQADNNLDKINKPEDLVYVIYTSGSTGKPKGVMIEHHSLINRIEWMQKCYPANQSSVFLQKTIYTFDVSVWELFWWSIMGAHLYLLAPRTEHDPRYICKIINHHKVSHIHFVPSVFRIFLDYIEVKCNQDNLRSLKYIFTSGERLDANLVSRFFTLFKEELGIKLVNLYGPTEATIDVTYFNCLRGEDYTEIPIGKPIDNTRIFILGEDNDMKPIGEVGEICIAGAGLAQGYLKRPDLNSEKFSHFDSERIYKTGDLGKYRSDGNVIFLGRKDSQVKLRGLRIELEEIEFHLLKHPQISNAAVLVKKDKQDNQYLCAYIVTKSAVSPSELKSFIALSIPEYMVPTIFLELKDMPLKNNGKIDKTLLPEPF